MPNTPTATQETRPVHHMAAPEVEERKSHAYEGEGLGRRESLRWVPCCC